ncbi:hypothetical protein JCM3765_000213 [Sporobolomyces pararoseus]
MTKPKRPRSYSSSSSPDLSSSASQDLPLTEFSLPKEIVTLIIRFATKGKPNELLKFSLVSKVFKEISLKILYQELVIQGGGGWEQLNRYVTSYKKNKSKKKKKGVKEFEEEEEIEIETKSFELKLETIYPIPLLKSLNNLSTIFKSFSTSLTILSITLPPNCHNPLPHLFSSNLSTLASLIELKEFKLNGGGEIWFHDLIKLLFSSKSGGWSKLEILELNCLLRGDSNSPLPPLPTTQKGEEGLVVVPKLKKLIISKTSLNSKMIKYLFLSLKLQGNSLKWLEIPLPGSPPTNDDEVDLESKLAWEAIEGLFKPEEEEGGGGGGGGGGSGGGGSGLKVLKVWDRFWESTCAKKRKEQLKKKKEEIAKSKKAGGSGGPKLTKAKSKKKVQPDSDEDQDDEEEEIDELASEAEEQEEKEEAQVPIIIPSSPFLSLFLKYPQNSLTSLLLTTSFLPSLYSSSSSTGSSFSSSKSFKELLPHLNRLIELIIEDTKQSRLRDLVKKVLIKGRGNELTSLKKLVSIGIKKKKGGGGRKKITTKGGKGKKGVVASNKGKKGKKKIQDSNSESEEEEDELASSSNSDDSDEEEDQIREESDETKKKKEMTKTELIFYEFCLKKGIEWRIQRDYY